jgi:hypothetical protein
VWGAIVLTRQPRWDRITAATLAPARHLRDALRHGLPAGPPSLDMVPAMARPMRPTLQASTAATAFALAQASTRMRAQPRPPGAATDDRPPPPDPPPQPFFPAYPDSATDADHP